MAGRIITILLLVAFTAQSFTASFIRLDYFANAAAYAKNCINKRKPKMRCNGKCQVMKKIEEEQRKDQKDSERKYGDKSQVLSSKSFFTTISFYSNALVAVLYPGFSDKAPCSRAYAFFHPPCA